MRGIFIALQISCFEEAERNSTNHLQAVAVFANAKRGSAFAREVISDAPLIKLKCFCARPVPDIHNTRARRHIVCECNASSITAVGRLGSVPAELKSPSLLHQS